MLDQQLATLRDTRDRSGRLLTAATLLVGLGGLTFRFDLAERVTVWGLSGAILALAGLSGVWFTTAAIWRPADLQTTQDPIAIISGYVEGTGGMELPQLHRDLAVWIGRQADANRAILIGRAETFTWGLWALMVEVVGITVLLGDVAFGYLG